MRLPSAGAILATFMLAERLTAQLLAGEPARTPEAVVERLLAVQGQDPRGARLAVRARSTGLSAADLDRALNEGALLITWLNRGTLHLVCAEDYPWLHALTAPRLATSAARRLAQEGLSPAAAERALRALERALVKEGPLTGAQLRERIAAAGVKAEGQAPLHLLFMASMRGILVRGPMVARQQAYVLTRDWLGQPRGDRPGAGRLEGERALAELARRYLRGHEPASERDLAKWSGLPLGDARAGLRAIASELAPRADGLLGLSASANLQAAELPPPRLLGAFDPVLLGWSSREPILTARREAAVVRGGMFRPFALAQGRAVAAWTLRGQGRGGAGGRVELQPFERLRRSDRVALEADAAAVLAYLAGRPAPP